LEGDISISSATAMSLATLVAPPRNWKNLEGNFGVFFRPWGAAEAQPELQKLMGR
jgi:hypothetical protein